MADSPTAPSTPPLQDRRRTSVHSDALAAKPEMRRTPSLSICIPQPQPSAEPQPARPAPPAPRVRPSPMSASSAAASPLASPWTPKPRLASQPAPSAHAGAWPRPPRTPYPKRPAMVERTPSASTMATYTSFDLQAPCTPRDERELREAELGGARACWARWFAFVRALNEGDLEQGGAGERTALLGGGHGEGEGEQRTTLRYVLAETWCYAKHMLPPILFFVVLVLVVALLAYRHAVGRIVHPPSP